MPYPTPIACPPSLALLSCSSPTQLADFCAMVVPCIWSGSFRQRPAAPPLMDSKRFAAFRLFCQKILKATQISWTCIVLALYYIHRLRSQYPSIHASIGSEVRLFTTALVLANKYLDDNTFTNKTWSEVSSIPMSELNIMEIEFLSALDYNIHLHHQTFFSWAMQCQQWFPLAQSVAAAHQRSTLPQSASMPNVLPSTAVKRSSSVCLSDHQPSAKRRHQNHHMPYTPPNDTIRNPSVHPPYTPLYTPTSANPFPTPPSSSVSSLPWKNSQVCRPILTWSSSSSVLASTRHAMKMPTMPSSYNPYSVATAAAVAAVNANYSASILTSRVRCLEIE